jgi:hypothetical protein
VALETKCLTGGAVFHTEIHEEAVSVEVSLPFKLALTEKEAELLEKLIHNQLELVLRPYFEARRSDAHLLVPM